MTGPLSPAEKAQWVNERARAIGFDLCGIAPVAVEDTALAGGGKFAGGAPGSFSELTRLPEWLASGYAGEMNYLSDPRRGDPRLVLDGARSLIVVALNYNSALPYSTKHVARSGSLHPTEPAETEDEPPHGWISRYAWGDDYHTVLREKLDTLLAGMRVQFSEPFEARRYVDTGPIIERVAAKYAGLGWLAKNTCLINQQLGSWLFLGVIITTLPLEPTLAPDQPPASDLCGTCTRCLDACPTQAFPAPYVLDSRRCISYLTIELRGAIPEEFRAPLGSALIGCDICQDVCPWNRKAPVTRLSAFAPRHIAQTENPLPEMDRADTRGEILTHVHQEPPATRVPREETSLSLFAPELAWVAALSQAEFSEIFRRSAAKRTKWRGLVRNACVALGNSGIARESESYSRIIFLLERLACSDDPLISEHARWALTRLTNSRESQSFQSPDSSISGQR